MIDFYKFEPQFGLRDASPFCLKLATYLRLANVPHNTIEVMDPRKAPKRKMPYIIDGGEEIGDSELVIRHLKAKFGDPLAEGISETQKAVGHAFSVMLAERFYWVLIHNRWLEEAHQPLLREAWFAPVPKPLRIFISNLAFKDMKRIANGHGIGRHSRNEVYQLGISDVGAIESQLGDKPFFLDDKPREVDASVYAFLANGACELFSSPVCDRIRSNDRLMAYIDRVDNAAFGGNVLKWAA